LTDWREKYRECNRDKMFYEGRNAFLRAQYDEMKKAYEDLVALNISQVTTGIENVMRENGKLQAKLRFIQAEHKHLQDKYKQLKRNK